ncbi:hypothetical protein HYU95_02515 [Candidatus Daviesbacteria bacterium]|nr:hypothetical protein [Candidatus Daviesbacteria bacterium]
MKYFTGGNGMLVSPGVGKIVGQPTALPTSMPVPQTPSFNPPKEIQYSSGTDLRQELESINPQVLDSDFE